MGSLEYWAGTCSFEDQTCLSLLSKWLQFPLEIISCRLLFVLVHKIHKRKTWQIHLYSAIFKTSHLVNNAYICILSESWMINHNNKQKWCQHTEFVLTCTHSCVPKAYSNFTCKNRNRHNLILHFEEKKLMIHSELEWMFGEGAGKAENKFLFPQSLPSSFIQIC